MTNETETDPPINEEDPRETFTTLVEKTGSEPGAEELMDVDHTKQLLENLIEDQEVSEEDNDLITSEIEEEVRGNLFDYTEAFQLPVPNEANKKLQDELMTKQRQRDSKRKQMEVLTQKMFMLKNHRKNVFEENQNILRLLYARQSQMGAEKHMHFLKEREKGNIQSAIQRVNNEIGKLEERSQLTKDNLFQLTKKYDSIVEAKNWNEKALQAWLEESTRKHEDQMMLKKYSKQDEVKLRELTLKIESLDKNIDTKQHQLDRVVNETHSAQVQLVKTSKDYADAHHQRQNLLYRWELVVEKMLARDVVIENLAEDIMRYKVEEYRVEKKIRERRKQLNNEKKNNGDMVNQLVLQERHRTKLRATYQDSIAQFTIFSDELNAAKRKMERTSHDVEGTRVTNMQMKKQITDCVRNMEKLKVKQELLKNELVLSKNEAGSSEQKAKQLQQIVAKEKQYQDQMQVELKKISEKKFQVNSKLQGSIGKKKDVIADIDGMNVLTKNLNSKITQLDHEALKQQEIIYHQDFTIQQLERRIARLQGDRVTSENSELHSKIKTLQTELEAKQKTYDTMLQQHKRIQDDIRRTKRIINESDQSNEKYESKIKELDLKNTNIIRIIKKHENEKENLMVEENLLKLQLRKLDESLLNKSKDVFGEEKKEQNLKTAMEERLNEIKIHQQMLQAEKKIRGSERQKLVMEINDRSSKIEKLQKKYDVLIVAMKPPEEISGEEWSQAYYVIQAAQQKEELQREGDNLDTKIHRKQVELTALQNTLLVVEARNEKCKKSFGKLNVQSKLYQEKKKTDITLQNIRAQVALQRRTLKELEEDEVKINQMIEAVHEELKILDSEHNAVKDEEDKLRNKIDQQKEKINKCSTTTHKQWNTVRTKNNDLYRNINIEKDLSLRELHDFNQFIINRIAELSINNDIIEDRIILYFNQNNISLPNRRLMGQRRHKGTGSSVSSFSQSSVRSSVSSIRRSVASSVTSHGRQSAQSLSKLQPNDVSGEIILQGTSLGSGTPSSRSSFHTYGKDKQSDR